MKSRAFYLVIILGVVAILTIMSGLSACSSSPTTPAATTTIPPSSTAPPLTSSTPPPSTTSSAPLTVKTGSSATLGNYLVDANGMTLYYFARDTVGKSNASATVLASWPVFNPTSFAVPSTLNAADFSTITRDDGQKIATYKGWPLYNYAKDKAPGDTLGEGVGGIWFVIKVPFYSVLIQSNATLGNYLADAKGMTLYYFAKDSVGKSTTTGTVLANWPLFNPSAVTVPSTLNATDFGTITRDDGAKVATYKGWPLYYFINDKVSGDTLGQGVGGVWSVVNPANFPPAVTTSPSPTPTPPPPTPTATTTTPPPTTTPTPTPYSINIQNFAFSPISISVPIGAKVVWTNNDSIIHTVTSDSGAFNGTVNIGTSFTFTFTQAGSFPYHCSIHPSMTGMVVVH
jgi:predicted lipoprotein with Yx(FWY)xxD motif/plastocyanin